jgi:ADP-ribose pyrophosphatase YjhB (NUDIX family)
MTSPPIVRRAARAVLIDNDGRLVAIKRTRPGQPPYWTTAGGEVEPDETATAAAAREVAEELGAVVRMGPQVFLTTTPKRDGVQVQHFFLARLIGLDESLRTGPELTDPSRGTYETVRIPLADLADVDLRPVELRNFIIANTTALLADLPEAE